MKRTGLFLMLALLLMPLASTGDVYDYPVQPPDHFDLETLNSIAVLDNGRLKPLESFSGKYIETITGRWTFKGIDPTAYVLAIMAFPEFKDANIILVDHIGLKEVLGFDPSQKHFSYNKLMSSPMFEQLTTEVMRKQNQDMDLNLMENKVGEVMHRVINYQNLMSGNTLFLVPPPPGELSHEEADWYTVHNATMYDQATQDKFDTAFHDVIHAVQENDAQAFTAASVALKQAVSSLNLEIYPTQTEINRELTYNSVRPFMWSWIVFLLAFLVMMTAIGLKNRKFAWAGTGLFILGFALSTYGLVIRWMIAGRPPVSNMYESVIFVAWGVLFFALIYELIYRQRWFTAVASGVGFVLFVMADLMPFDSNIEPLVPVLRSNYWLIIHVMTIVISYSAFALATGLAHAVLGLYFFKTINRALIKTIFNFMYRVIQLGTVLLAAGTILGGVWAAESWGRFWGWDPKETWALISLLGYMAILHARFTGWIKIIGTAICTIIGFQLIIMTWYGVNFVLGKGLHSYGFGSGGGWYVTGYLILEGIFLTVFGIYYFMKQPKFDQRPPISTLDDTHEDKGTTPSDDVVVPTA